MYVCMPLAGGMYVSDIHTTYMHVCVCRMICMYASMYVTVTWYVYASVDALVTLYECIYLCM